MKLYQMIDRIDVIKDNIEHLDSSVWEGDENGDCLADNEDFKSLLNFLQIFVNAYK